MPKRQTEGSPVRGASIWAGSASSSPRNVLTEFNVDERPLVCEGCRYPQMPSPSLVDSREPNGEKTPPAFCRDELYASRLQIRRWSRRVERSRVLSFGDYRRRLVTGQQNDAHQRCGSPSPIDATQTNSAIALQKCRNNSERSALKGWLGANNHGALQWPETYTTKQPNITKTPPRATATPPNIMARVTMPRARNTPQVLSSIRRPRISIVIKPIQRVSSRNS